jgi:hypothetical protein
MIRRREKVDRRSVAILPQEPMDRREPPSADTPARRPRADVPEPRQHQPHQVVLLSHDDILRCGNWWNEPREGSNRCHARTRQGPCHAPERGEQAQCSENDGGRED